SAEKARLSSPAGGGALAVRSDGVFAGFAGADADDLFDRRHEDLAVADLARVGRTDDGLAGLLHQAIAHHELDAHLGQEVHDILGAAIELGVALLPTKTLDLGYRQASDAHFRQRLANLVELERFDDG